MRLVPSHLHTAIKPEVPVRIIRVVNERLAICAGRLNRKDIASRLSAGAVNAIARRPLLLFSHTNIFR